jgi:hypothetical protein
MKPFKVMRRVDKKAIAQVKALSRATGRGANVKVTVKAVGNVVQEDTLWNGVTESALDWNFDSEEEAAEFAAQRASWIANSVVPICGGDVPAEPFVFTYPPP